MKIIYPDNISAVAADEEAANFPDDNLLDEHPKKLWKATSVGAQVKLTVAAGSNAVAMFNTNASDITVTIKNEAETATLVAASTIDLAGIDTFHEFIVDSGEEFTSFWYDYAYQAVTHTIIIDLTATSTVEAGVVVAGYANVFKDPQYGLREEPKDCSITKEYSNGAFYYRKRDVLRTFSATIRATRDRDFYNFMRDIVIKNGPAPLAFNLSDKLTNQDWGVYGRFDMKSIDGRHDAPKYSMINFKIIEVV